jgi:hypothetical protein
MANNPEYLVVTTFVVTIAPYGQVGKRGECSHKIMFAFRWGVEPGE